MARLSFLAVACATAFSMSAMAQQHQTTERVRGTVESANSSMLTVKSHSGKNVDLAIGSDTKFASVVPSSLSDIKPGVFIGTATKGPKGHMVALEVLIFPDSMRGTGEGHYPWDMLPNTTVSSAGPGAAPEVKSSMTNGTVSSTTPPAGPPMVKSTMTNGTVETASPTTNAPMVKSTMTNATVAGESNKAGGEELTLSFNGKKLQVLVPPNVPVVALVPGQSSLLEPGAKVFVVAAKPTSGGEPSAKLVAVGKDGLTPPM